MPQLYPRRAQLDSLENRTLLSAGLIKDIATGTEGSNPVGVGDLNGSAIFIANDPATGPALYKTNGTDAGTTKLANLPGGGSSSSSVRTPITSGIGRVFFVSGTTLWTTDGTPAGTKSLGINLSPNSDLTEIADKVYFTSVDAAGDEPWISDGTAAGTRRLGDVNPGPDGSLSSLFAAGPGGYVYFTPYNSPVGSELYRTDGTTVSLSVDVVPGTQGSEPHDYTYVGGKLFFIATVASTPKVFSTDGATGRAIESTFLAGFTPAVLSSVAGKVYVTGSGTSTSELYRIDPATRAASLAYLGTTAQTTLYHTRVYELNGIGYLIQTRSGSSTLYRTDGTSAGTYAVKTSLPFGITNLRRVGNTLSWIAYDNGLYNERVWSTDGTAANTFAVSSITNAGYLQSYTFGSAGNRTYFASNSTSAGNELFSFAAGDRSAALVKDIDTRAPFGSYPQYFRTGGRYAYFLTGYSGYAFSAWRTDGTAAGTVKLIDFTSYTDGINPWKTAAVGDTFFFSVLGKLYATDGSAVGTRQIADYGTDYKIGTLAAGTTCLYYSASDSEGLDLLYRIDTTRGDTPVPVSPLNETYWSVYSGDLVTRGDTAYFITGNGTERELWEVQGRTGSSRLVADVNANGSGTPQGLAPITNGVYSTPDGEFPNPNGVFAIATNDDGVKQVVKYLDDGSVLYVTLSSGAVPYAYESFSGSPLAGYTAAIGNFYFFRASNAATGKQELWRTDGTPEGTERLLADTFAVRDMTVAGGRLFFVNDGQLWVTNGSANDTIQLSTALGAQNFFDSPYGSSGPLRLTALGRNVFFIARTASNGIELYQSDGTVDGTKLFADVNPGTGNGLYAKSAVELPSTLAALGDRIIFAGNDGKIGAEPWMAWETPTVVIVAPFSVTEGTSVNVSAWVTASPGTTVAAVQWDFNYDRNTSFDVDATGTNVTFTAGANDGPSNRAIAARVIDARGGIAVEVFPIIITDAPKPGATIAGLVFSDKNKNLKKDAGETAIVNATVWLDLDGDRVIDAGETSVITDSTGAYKFSNVQSAGSSANTRVRLVVPSSGTQTSPASGYGYTVTLTSGAQNLAKDFGVYLPGVTPPPPPPATGASIKGSVFLDKNKNAKRDSGDTGIANITLWLDLDGDKIIDANETKTVTDSAGSYTFSNVPTAGNSANTRVRVVLTGGYKQSLPTSNFGYTVNLAAKATNTGKDFGLYK